MTDITELAQRNELLIANGQQTADLLRHLADNEIDSDYFAVVSECESYGKETDAELSITEFALRAAGYVDALVEALELKEEQRANWSQMAQKLGEDLDAAEKRIAELESRTVTVKLPDIMPPEAAPAHYWGSGESMAYADGYNKSAADLKTSFALSCSSAGVNVEFE
ncbi:hypothetical protein [Klebsiella pneumoniae]|uniref:hypothetical protein n=1 Tax=Klebsiella pneumoniae TaxID=573 RepID=UPI002AAAC833|nr:hypothetical protein [Klebsiella pneumoniae]